MVKPFFNACTLYELQATHEVTSKDYEENVLRERTKYHRIPFPTTAYLTVTRIAGHSRKALCPQT